MQSKNIVKLMDNFNKEISCHWTTCSEIAGKTKNRFATRLKERSLFVHAQVSQKSSNSLKNSPT